MKRIKTHPYDKFWIYDGVQKPDGKYLLMLEVQDWISPYEYLLSEYTEKGELSRNFSYSVSASEVFPSKFKYFNNGDLFLSASSGLFNFSYLWDSNGNVLWSFLDTFYFTELISNRNNEYTGFVNTIDESSSIKTSNFIKISNFGEIIWKIPDSVFQLLDDTLTDKLVYLNALNIDTTYNIFFQVKYASNTLFVVNVSENGQILSNSILQFPYKISNPVYKSQSGLLCPLSERINDTLIKYYLAKVDTSSNIEWIIKSPSRIKSLIEDSFSRIHLLVYQYDPDNDTTKLYGIIKKLNSKGQEISNISIYIHDRKLSLYTMVLIHDGNYFLTGKIEDDGIPWGEQTGVIIKTDSLGNIDINDFSSINTYSQFSNKIQVFPNPFHSYCTINIPTQTNKTSTIYLYNLQGKLIRKEKFLGNKFVLDRKDLKSGLYLYKIVRGSGHYAGKLVVVD